MARARAVLARPDSRWLCVRMCEEIADRLSFMSLDVRRALVIGEGMDAVLRHHSNADVFRLDLTDAGHPDIVAEEDRLPIADASMDLVIAVGTLDTVHDLPGALLLIRRILRPGGLFLGAMLGAGSLPALREKLTQFETDAGGNLAARFHPQVDVRAAGDLLFRAGFSTPVADHDMVTASYKDIRGLIGDIRATSANALPKVQPLARDAAQRLVQEPAWAEQFGILYLTGWGPVAGEVRPAGPVKGSY